jgi:uncharacterized membrane protein YeaQ/YmgE (transglycosylase-associated protein family)
MPQYTSIIVWIIIGGAAGWLAGQITKGRGYGCLGNVVVGIIGSIVGGWLFHLTGISFLGAGLIGSLITAVIGAVVLIFVLNLLTGRR